MRRLAVELFCVIGSYKSIFIVVLLMINLGLAVGRGLSSQNRDNVEFVFEWGDTEDGEFDLQNINQQIINPTATWKN